MDSLVYDDKEHKYYADGRELISVTTLLNLEGASTGMEFVDEFFRNRGTFVHLATAYHDRGVLDRILADTSGNPAIVAFQEGFVAYGCQGFLDSWKRYRDSTGIAYTSEHIEVRLADPVYGFAGCLDRLPLLDVKSGAPKLADSFQIGAYYGLCQANKIDTDYYLSDKARKIVYLNDDGSAPNVASLSVKDTLSFRNDFYAALRWHRAKLLNIPR